MINTESSELQSMTALELTNMTVYSMCSNPRFARLICSEERIKSRYRFFYVSSGLKDNDKTTRDIRNKTRNSKDFQVFVFVFSYPDQDPGVDDSLLSLVSGAVTIIDATAVRMDRSNPSSGKPESRRHRSSLSPERSWTLCPAGRSIREWRP